MLTGRSKRSADAAADGFGGSGGAGSRQMV
jgi:hypothetical protein